MTTSAVLRNAYTDAPELHSNLILGSLQLLFWLFFHPSAWRNYVAHIDPTLRPDFCLAELSQKQWRNPALWRLLMMAYLVWPLIVGLLMGPMLWLEKVSPDEKIVWLTAVSVGLVLGYGVVGGATFGLAFGMASGVAGAITTNHVLGLDTEGLADSIGGNIVGSIIGGKLGRSLIRQVGGITWCPVSI
jgi:hypothetical protein